MKRIVIRTALVAAAVAAWFIGDVFFNMAEKEASEPRAFVFSLPLPPETLERYSLTEHSPLDVKDVVVSGFFSDWSQDDPAFRMERKTFDRWESRVTLSSGRNQYKFVVKLGEAVTDSVTGQPTSVIWARDLSNSVRTDDGFGGWNSVVSVPAVDDWRFYFRLFVASFALLVLVSTLLELFARLVMRLSLPLSARLALSVALVVAVSGAALAASHLHLEREALKDSYEDMMNLMHQALISEGVSPADALNSKPAQDKLQAALDKLFARAVTRVESRKLSSQQLTVTAAAVLDAGFHPVASVWAPDARRQAQAECEKAGFTDADDYLVRGVMRNLLAEARSKSSTGYRLEFGSTPAGLLAVRPAPERAALRWTGADLLLYPVLSGGKPAFWYAARFHPESAGNRIRGGFFFDLFVIGLSLVLSTLVLLTLGRFLASTAPAITGNAPAPSNPAPAAPSDATMEEHVHNLKLINVIDTCLTGIRDPDELYRVFLTFLTANFGFRYNRGAIFLLEEGKLVGRYAIGMLDREELVATFGSYENYLNLRIDINSFLENPASFLEKTDNRFTDAVREIVIAPDDESAILDAIWTRQTLHVPLRNDDPKAMDRILRRRLNLGEYAVTPVYENGRPVGALLLDNRFDGRPLTEDLLEELLILTNGFSLHLQNLAEERLHEEALRTKENEINGAKKRAEETEKRIDELVQDLHRADETLRSRDGRAAEETRFALLSQEHWLSGATANAAKLGVSVSYRAARDISGDFFDCRAMPDGRLRAMIAKLSLQGAPAEALRHSLLSIWQEASSAKTPGEALRDWNRLVFEAYPDSGLFFSASAVDVDRAAKRIVYSHAGGNPLFLFPEGSVIPLTKRGKVIGGTEGVRYLDEDVPLNGAARLLLSTEGLLLSRNRDGDVWDSGRLSAAEEKTRGLSSGKLANAVLEDFLEWAGNSSRRDSVCLLGIEG
jgi:serine phosphatase RsbU (regulator of sigma subunit)